MLSKNRLKEAVANRYLWIVAAMLAASTFLHYFTPQVRLPPLVSFPLTRHTIERIIFLLPIAGASFAFGQAGGLITLALASLIMLPRAFLSSPYPADAILETVAVAMVGYLIVILVPLWQAVIVGAIFFLSWSAISLPATMSLIARVLPMNKRTKACPCTHWCEGFRWPWGRCWVGR